MARRAGNALLIVLACASLSGGETGASAVATVRVEVRRTVSVGVISIAVDAGVVDTGPVVARIGFRVDANTPSVTLFVEATALHKAGPAETRGATPIPVDRAAGAVIAPTDAAPASGGGNVAAYLQVSNVDGMPAERSDAIRFESSQPGRFSQNVHVTVTWDQSDPDRPVGIYTGRIKLTAIVMP